MIIATFKICSGLVQIIRGYVKFLFDLRRRACGLNILAASGLLFFSGVSYAGTVTVPSSVNYSGTFTISWVSGPPYAKMYQKANGGNWTGGGMVSGYSGTITYTLPAGTYVFRADTCTYSPGPPPTYYPMVWNCPPGTPSSPITVVTSPPSDVPSISLASMTYSGSYSFTWNSTAYTTEYRWQQRINGGSWGDETTVSGTAASVSGNGTATYGYQVRACNPNGCGSYGAEKSIVVITTPPSTAPSITIPAVSYDGVYSFSWNPITYATGYKWQRRINGGDWGSGTETAASETSVSIQDSGSGTYSYRVSACNPNGCGAYGNEASIIVLGDTTSYQYDELGRLIQVRHPSEVANDYEYDAADNRISKESTLAD